MGDFGMIAIILLAALLSGTLFRKIGLPSVVGQLVVGVVVGPAMLNWVKPTSDIEFLAEIGVMTLMFIAGLESDLRLLKKYLIPAISVATFGAIIPVATFYWFGTSFLHESIGVSIFFGIVFAAMSTSITVDVLKEFKRLKTKNGQTILGAAIFDDVFAISLLSVFLVFFTNGAPVDGHGPSHGIGMTLLLQVLFFILAFSIIRWVATPVMNWFEKLDFPYSDILGAFIMLFTLASLAELFGLSAIIGTFFSGVAIAETDVAHRVEKASNVVSYTFFIPIFLVSVGLHVHLDKIMDYLPLIIVGTILAILSKLVGSGMGAKLTGYSWVDSAIIGTGTVPRGEFSIVIAQMGLAAGVINSDQQGMLLIIIILATIIGPLLLRYLFKFDHSVEEEQPAEVQQS
ncbi:Kef-type K+ transport system membrane component KefB [Weissella uvarum]|uniref:cation:proton antiporter n=1 Tax=Weissella uvarum TaxID=1479233 RepID=UPI00195F9F58|nr:cation:proton antiporter [Weissella uvarum]MBM7616984.1 Kef-type K+ transport system membrane component KefB [Weissella uvarum]MCM0595284.1 cation:proton antiporter [Weissella uvarum]